MYMLTLWGLHGVIITVTSVTVVDEVVCVNVYLCDWYVYNLINDIYNVNINAS